MLKGRVRSRKLGLVMVSLKFESHSVTFFYVPKLPYTAYPITIYPQGRSGMFSLNTWTGPQHQYICIDVPGMLHNEAGPAVIDCSDPSFGKLERYYLDGRNLSYDVWIKMRSKLSRVFYG